MMRLNKFAFSVCLSLSASLSDPLYLTGTHSTRAHSGSFSLEAGDDCRLQTEERKSAV